MPWIDSFREAPKMQLITIHKDFSILNYILGDAKKHGVSLKSETPRPNLVPETGLEPVRGCPQRFLRP